MKSFNFARGCKKAINLFPFGLGNGKRSFQPIDWRINTLLRFCIDPGSRMVSPWVHSYYWWRTLEFMENWLWFRVLSIFFLIIFSCDFFTIMWLSFFLIDLFCKRSAVKVLIGSLFFINMLFQFSAEMLEVFLLNSRSVFIRNNSTYIVLLCNGLKRSITPALARTLKRGF